jgi:hypothetical protein
MANYWIRWLCSLIPVGPHFWPNEMGDCENEGILNLISVGPHPCPKGMGEYWIGRPQTPTSQAQARRGRYQQPDGSNNPGPSVMTRRKHISSTQESRQDCGVQRKQPPGDTAQKQVTTPKGKNHRNDDTKQVRNAATIGKCASLGMPKGQKSTKTGASPTIKEIS